MPNSSPQAQKITLLGAGVAGLTTAVVLQEAGYQVNVCAREFSPHTTSDLAGAIWYPSHNAPVERTKNWGLSTLKELLRLYEEEGAEVTGIRLVKGVRHFFRQVGNPWWRESVPQFRILPESERAERARTSYEYTVPLIDMPHYLGRYLRNRLLKAGGTLTEKTFSTWEQALSESEATLVNCTGLGSFDLLQDKALYPVRGQVLESKSLQIDEFVLSADHPEGSIYVLPRRQGVILGGGSRSGVWDKQVDPAHAERTRRLAAMLSTKTGATDDWEMKVGLRPGRKQIRCERDDSAGKTVVHNYGHTGAGVTVSWGCAREVLSLLSVSPSH